MEDEIEKLKTENTNLKQEKEAIDGDKDAKAAHLSELETRITHTEEESEAIKQEKDSLA